MTTPINLNKARKARAKVAKEQAARENRAKFGRTKAEKKRDAINAEKATKSVDSHALTQKSEEEG